MFTRNGVVAATLTVLAAACSAFGGLQFITVPSPGGGSISGVNDIGQIVGVSGTQGVVFSGSNYQLFNFGAGSQPSPADINNSGVITGSEKGSPTTFHAYVGTVGNFTQFDAPGATSTLATSINDAGDVAGYFFSNAAPRGTPYVRTGTTITPFTLPFSNLDGAGAFGINNSGAVVGQFFDGTKSNGRGFLKVGSTYTAIDMPGIDSSGGTQATAINDAGEIAGAFIQTTGDNWHAFYKIGNTYTPIDIPGATSSIPTAVSSDGTIYGIYSTATGSGNFAFTVPEPVAAPLLLCCGFAFIRRRVVSNHKNR